LFYNIKIGFIYGIHLLLCQGISYLYEILVISLFDSLLAKAVVLGGDQSELGAEVAENKGEVEADGGADDQHVAPAAYVILHVKALAKVGEDAQVDRDHQDQTFVYELSLVLGKQDEGSAVAHVYTEP